VICPKVNPKRETKASITPTRGDALTGEARYFVSTPTSKSDAKLKTKKGLQDALRGILDAGGNITEDWELTKALKVGDQATGTTVLTDLYNQMKDKPVAVDLQEKWKQLGIEWDGSAVHLRDDAPEVAIRRAITGAVSPASPVADVSVHYAANAIAVMAGRKPS